MADRAGTTPAADRPPPPLMPYGNEMKNYVIIFSITYFFFMALLAFLLPARVGHAGITLVALMAASFFSAHAFVKDSGRQPTDAEKSGFACGSLSSAVLISLALLLLLPARTLETLGKALGSPLFVCISAVIAIALGYIYYLAIKWSFAWYARRAAR